MLELGPRNSLSSSGILQSDRGIVVVVDCHHPAFSSQQRSGGDLYWGYFDVDREGC